MDVSKRRVGVRGSVVAAGSVWESRMKSDEVRGGVKVFNGEENAEEGGENRLKRNQLGSVVGNGKRKTWKSGSNEGLEKSQIQIARGKTEPKKNCVEQCKELSISCDGIKKSPIQVRKLRSEGSREIGVSDDKFERSPIQTRKLRSQVQNGSSELRKSKSDSVKSATQSAEEIQLRKTKSELDHGIDGSDGGCGETIIENGKNDSDENEKDFGVCRKEVILSNSDKVGVVDCDSNKVIADEADEGEEEEEEEEEVVDEEIDIEVEKRSFEIKEISIPEPKDVNESESNEPEKQNAVNEPEPLPKPEKQKVVVSPNRRFHQKNVAPLSVPLTVKQSPPIRKHSTIHQNFSKVNSIPKAEEYHSFPQTHNKLQSLVDLIMWRDISRSAFVFGSGTFIIVSSSYAKDINLSVISVLSYMSLIYLAAVFLYRSIICRGVIDVGDTNYVLGEEEAIWVLKLILPYLNEFLSRLKAMFSGDPGTTIKLAVLLFVLARCGSSITIWKMVRLGFFGVFTLPKFCSSYSAQLTAYGKFWIRRFRDAWDSCSHKKAVALGIFLLVWNLSSVVARIWAVFVLFVAFKYYQQHYLVRDEWVGDEEGSCEETWHEPVGVGVKRQGCKPKFAATNKVKKDF